MSESRILDLAHMKDNVDSGNRLLTLGKTGNQKVTVVTTMNTTQNVYDLDPSIGLDDDDYQSADISEKEKYIFSGIPPIHSPDHLVEFPILMDGRPFRHRSLCHGYMRTYLFVDWYVLTHDDEEYEDCDVMSCLDCRRIWAWSCPCHNFYSLNVFTCPHCHLEVVHSSGCGVQYSDFTHLHQLMRLVWENPLSYLSWLPEELLVTTLDLFPDYKRRAMGQAVFLSQVRCAHKRECRLKNRYLCEPCLDRMSREDCRMLQIREYCDVRMQLSQFIHTFAVTDSSWIEDLTADGDVEANPGPCSGKLYTHAYGRKMCICCPIVKDSEIFGMPAISVHTCDGIMSFAYHYILLVKHNKRNNCNCGCKMCNKMVLRVLKERQNWLRQTMWIPDLTIDGDVESNPGPLILHNGAISKYIELILGKQDKDMVQYIARPSRPNKEFHCCGLGKKINGHEVAHLPGPGCRPVNEMTFAQTTDWMYTFYSKEKLQSLSEELITSDSELDVHRKEETSNDEQEQEDPDQTEENLPKVDSSLPPGGEGDKDGKRMLREIRKRKHAIKKRNRRPLTSSPESSTNGQRVPLVSEEVKRLQEIKAYKEDQIHSCPKDFLPILLLRDEICIGSGPSDAFSFLAKQEWADFWMKIDPNLWEFGENRMVFGWRGFYDAFVTDVLPCLAGRNMIGSLSAYDGSYSGAKYVVGPLPHSNQLGFFFDEIWTSAHYDELQKQGFGLHTAFGEFAIYSKKRYHSVAPRYELYAMERTALLQKYWNVGDRGHLVVLVDTEAPFSFTNGVFMHDGSYVTSNRTLASHRYSYCNYWPWLVQGTALFQAATNNALNIQRLNLYQQDAGYYQIFRSWFATSSVADNIWRTVMRERRIGQEVSHDFNPHDEDKKGDTDLPPPLSSDPEEKLSFEEFAAQKHAEINTLLDNIDPKVQGCENNPSIKTNVESSPSFIDIELGHAREDFELVKNGFLYLLDDVKKEAMEKGRKLETLVSERIEEGKIAFSRKHEFIEEEFAEMIEEPLIDLSDADSTPKSSMCYPSLWDQVFNTPGSEIDLGPVLDDLPDLEEPPLLDLEEIPEVKNDAGRIFDMFRKNTRDAMQYQKFEEKWEGIVLTLNQLKENTNSFCVSQCIRLYSWYVGIDNSAYAMVTLACERHGMQGLYTSDIEFKMSCASLMPVRFADDIWHMTGYPVLRQCAQYAWIDGKKYDFHEPPPYDPKRLQVQFAPGWDWSLAAMSDLRPEVLYFVYYGDTYVPNPQSKLWTTVYRTGKPALEPRPGAVHRYKQFWKKHRHVFATRVTDFRDDGGNSTTLENFLQTTAEMAPAQRRRRVEWVMQYICGFKKYTPGTYKFFTKLDEVVVLEASSDDCYYYEIDSEGNIVNGKARHIFNATDFEIFHNQGVITDLKKVAKSPCDYYFGIPEPYSFPLELKNGRIFDNVYLTYGADVDNQQESHWYTHAHQTRGIHMIVGGDDNLTLFTLDGSFIECETDVSMCDQSHHAHFRDEQSATMRLMGLSEECVRLMHESYTCPASMFIKQELIVTLLYLSSQLKTGSGITSWANTFTVGKLMIYIIQTIVLALEKMGFRNVDAGYLKSHIEEEAAALGMKLKVKTYVDFDIPMGTYHKRYFVWSEQASMYTSCPLPGSTLKKLFKVRANNPIKFSTYERILVSGAQSRWPCSQNPIVREALRSIQRTSSYKNPLTVQLNPNQPQIAQDPMWLEAVGDGDYSAHAQFMWERYRIDEVGFSALIAWAKNLDVKRAIDLREDPLGHLLGYMWRVDQC